MNFTVNQLLRRSLRLTPIKKGRKRVAKRGRVKRKFHAKGSTRILGRRPHRSGIAQAMAIVNPKKPNSAKRKVVITLIKDVISEKRKFKDVKASGQPYTVTRTYKIYAPGEDIQVAPYSRVLIEGKARKDLIASHTQIKPGACDISGIKDRTRSRSRYGTPLQRENTDRTP